MKQDKSAQFVVHLDIELSDEQKAEIERSIQSAVLQKVVEMGFVQEISSRSFPTDSSETASLQIGWPPILGLWLD